MKVLGLTGPIGSGKSFVASLFVKAGAPVFDADREVHRIYAEDTKRIAALAVRFPEAGIGGKIDRARLARIVLHDEAALRDLEAIVHPAVRLAEQEFLAEQKRKRTALAVLDIPLLFQTGADGLCDAVLLLTAPESVRKARVLARPGMSEEKWRKIVASQGETAYNGAKADFILDTDRDEAVLAKEVNKIIGELAQ